MSIVPLAVILQRVNFISSHTIYKVKLEDFHSLSLDPHIDPHNKVDNVKKVPPQRLQHTIAGGNAHYPLHCGLDKVAPHKDRRQNRLSTNGKCQTRFLRTAAPRVARKRTLRVAPAYCRVWTYKCLREVASDLRYDLCVH